MREPSDQRWFREVLGQYPTGVCVVTATEPDGSRAGFVVGSFTSVSLEPPLIAFYPDKGSTSWPRIQAQGSFCVNILSDRQEHLCRRFAARGGDKFDGVRTRTSPSGAPIIEGAVAWIDCELASVQEAGDHYIVVGRVQALDVGSQSLPLLFFQGGYGSFSPLSLAAPSAPSARGDLADQLRQVDLVRPEMERLAADLSARCLVTAVVDDDLVVLASAGGAGAAARATLVGAHLPFAPPNGGAIAAWLPEPEVARWLKQLPDEPGRQVQREKLARVRERGYSLGLVNDAQRRFASALSRLAEDPAAVEADDMRGLISQLNYDPDDCASPEARSAVRVIAVPVFDAAGDVRLALTLYGFSRPHERGGIDAYVQRVCQAGQCATESLGGRPTQLQEDR